jgi:Zn finger protein HypA/HybF involved in hydrogenase expression
LVDRYTADIECADCGHDGPKDCWYDPELITDQHGFDCPNCGVPNRFDVEPDGYDIEWEDYT